MVEQILKREFVFMLRTKMAASCGVTAGAKQRDIGGAPRIAEADRMKLSGQGRRGDARRRESFLVRIVCRQHNSWQGEVGWKAQRLYFRSTLELMCLVHSALAPGVMKAKSAAGTIVRPVFRAA